ncbi:MAG: tetratricopeptide repeat protein [Desulfocapsaceae bacterium]|nr:tetratricopeptide repeat protein [Desulfocapsaceae bacterium]
MTEIKAQRKLSAILSADVKGYSKLMAEDDETTVITITTYRQIIAGLIIENEGRVVDALGDNILAVFSSALNAVNSAIAIQTRLRIENEKLPQNRRMQFRIGINLGDILHQDDTIYGNGVNVAARIESLTEPGGICVSRGVYDQVKKNIRKSFKYLGDHKVKNITEPVRIYSILMEPEFKGKVLGETESIFRFSRRKHYIYLASALLIMICAITIAYYFKQSPNIEPAAVEKMAYPLPDKPSIAVLPFENLSDDTSQEYFSDGITEHIITSLAKVPYLFVIARNSTYVYKNKFTKVQHIAEELGVRYILEGSVQRYEDKVRITAQLIDATEGYHIWADSFDRKMDDVFNLQDELAMKIMAELQVKLTVEELGRLSAIKTKNIKAYEKYLEGYEIYQRRTEAYSQQARALAEEAMALDPDYGAPYILLARTYLDDVWYYKGKTKESLNIAENLINKAIELAGQNSMTHQILGSVYYLRREYDEAIAECAQALKLSPNSAEANYYYGHALRWAGRFDEAIPAFEKAIRLNPVTPLKYINNLAWAHAYNGNEAKAIELWNQAINRNPDYFFAYLGLAMAYQLSGDEESAKKAATEVLRIKPNITITKIEKGPATRGIDRDRIHAAMHKAGIPK